MKKIIYLVVFLLCYCAYGQSLSVFDIDTSAFPTIKAKFYAFDANGKQITNLSPADFELKENGVARTVTNVSCPNPKPPLALSSVITIDISGSMSGSGLSMAKEAATVWINTIPLGTSECAINSFDDKNYINQDFTTNKNKLLNALNGLQANGGTDYDIAFWKPLTSSLLITKTGKHKKVIVFISDGQPNFEPQVNQIISEANSQNCAIFSVVVGNNCPQCLKDVSSQTGGQWFENIKTAEDAKRAFQNILVSAQGGDPCTIEWQSGTNCTGGPVNIDCQLIPNNISIIASYQTPISSIAFLDCRPAGVFFKNKPIGVRVDTNIIITAKNADFNVTNITSSDLNFEINPKSFNLAKGQSQTVKLSYTPPDSNRYFSSFIMENNLCQKKYVAVGGFVKNTTSKPTLKITHPNGGEIFAVGSDTLITWEGVLPSDKVKLEFSSDNGNSWNLITDTASGLKYFWKNIPKSASNQCLVRATQD
ncbi:MAG: VWA domain-containing protein, partial [Bacteroidota bacterium]